MKPTRLAPRANLLTLPLLALGLCSTASAQFGYVNGDVIAHLTTATSTSYTHISTFGSGAFGIPLAFAPGTTPAQPETAYDLDQSTGDLIYTAPGAGGRIEVFRNIITDTPGAPIVNTQVSLGTIPGTAGLQAVDLYTEIQGSILVLTETVPGPRRQDVFRIGIGSTGLVGYRVNTAAGLPATTRLTSVASLENGTVFVTGRRFSNQGIVYSIRAALPDGGTTLATLVNLVDTQAVEVGGGFGALQFSAGGSAISVAGQAPGNYICGTLLAAQAVVPPGVGVTTIVDLDRRADGAQIVSLSNGNPSTGSILLTSGCGGPAIPTLELYNNPAVVISRAKILSRSSRTGYAGVRGINVPGSMVPALIDGPATIGTGATYTATLRGGEPNGLAMFTLGFSDSSGAGGVPLPLDLTPVGAVGCAAFSSADQSVFVNLDSSGDGQISIPIPVNPALVGLTAFGQWVVFDAATPAGFITSNALRTTIQ